MAQKVSKEHVKLKLRFVTVPLRRSLDDLVSDTERFAGNSRPFPTDDSLASVAPPRQDKLKRKVTGTPLGAGLASL